MAMIPTILVKIKEVHGSLYGYTPTRAVCIVFVVLFSISTALHIGQASRYRLWWLFPTLILGGIGEIIGWSGRLWSSFGPGLFDPYLMQITTTIMAPSYMSAASFIILGIMIQRLGPQFSRLTPKIFGIFFICCDTIALVIQAVGGANASIAGQSGTGNPENGARIMVGGIIFQMAAITVYSILAVEFFLRFHYDRPVRRVAVVGPKPAMDKNVKLMILGLGISTLFIYIRSIYRTIELLNGWTGPIIQNEVLFNVLDGMCIVIAMFVINFLHPGPLLRKLRQQSVPGAASTKTDIPGSPGEDGKAESDDLEASGKTMLSKLPI